MKLEGGYKNGEIWPLQRVLLLGACAESALEMVNARCCILFPTDTGY